MQKTLSEEPAGGVRSPLCAVDLDRGESQVVEMHDGSKARVKLMEGQEPFAARTRVSLREGQWLINDEVTCRGARAEGLLMNVRMVNSVFEDRRKPDFDPEANTDRFLARARLRFPRRPCLYALSARRHARLRRGAQLGIRSRRFTA